MKNWGFALLVIIGFVSGIAFVYSCGGAGSGALAAVEAHFHDEITPGVFPIGASAFQGDQIELSGNGSTIRSVADPGSKGHAPLNLPFKCTIVGMEARVRNESPTSEVTVELHDGECLNAVCDTFAPIVSFDTSSYAPTSDAVVINAPAFSYEYDPTNLSRHPLWVSVNLNAYLATSRQRFWWAKIYYTVP